MERCSVNPSRSTRLRTTLPALALLAAAALPAPAEPASPPGDEPFSGLLGGPVEELPLPPSNPLRTAEPEVLDEQAMPPLPTEAWEDEPSTDFEIGIEPSPPEPAQPARSTPLAPDESMSGEHWEHGDHWEDDGWFPVGASGESGLLGGPNWGGYGWGGALFSGKLIRFCSRHSSTHGRSIGFGEPLRGTSWLNRPYHASTEAGALLITSSPAQDVSEANDLFGAVVLGWDWDHYWGSQLRLGWSTPTLDNELIDEQDVTDNFFLFDASAVYYPWGDSRTRPYGRLGVALVDFEFTDTQSQRRHAQRFTVPLAVGVKRLVRRNVAFKAEIANNIAVGGEGSETTNFLTLTFGLEGRYGGKSSSYWAWSPRGGAW